MSSKSQVFLHSLFREQRSSLTRFVARKVSDQSEAEDLVQDAFHNMLRMEAPEQLENPKAYLYQTAANLALNRIRGRFRQGRAEQQLKEAPERSAPDPEQITQGREQWQQLQQALADMPEKPRTALMLSRVENLSYQEIADAMGVSVSSVEKYLSTALKALRNLQLS